MLNKVIQLVGPRQFEPIYKNIDLGGNHIIVRPTHLSICHADQRYYQGLRTKEVLHEKLPMALIHEATGIVICDPNRIYKEGTPVVMVANDPIEKCAYINENYLKSSKFRGSGFDGFMQEYICISPDRVLPIPKGISPTVAAFTEMVTVSFHAISRLMKVAHQHREIIGVWGDGNLGYITSLLLKHMMPASKVYVFGAVEYKLHDFTFVDETFLSTAIPAGISIDHAFECVGGQPSSNAINQVIDVIEPEGSLALMGVSEEPVPINTRMVLEHGLRLFGNSRSGKEDYAGVLELYKKNPDITRRLEKLVGEEIPVGDIQDVVTAFERDIHKHMGKTIMAWNI